MTIAEKLELLNRTIEANPGDLKQIGRAHV